MALNAPKSPQQEFVDQMSAIDIQIEEWWAAYDRMGDVEKRQQRPVLRALEAHRFNLAAQRESAHEKDLADYEKKIQNRVDSLLDQDESQRRRLESLPDSGLESEQSDEQSPSPSVEDSQGDEYEY
ncbi:unnamed protein product [Clonostachys solani]|uniref:Uncharacterized protein n=1 Tax=Clonostachys solani TaxID=160281 RepID=A0A9N9WB23_9HYPO|nr:unnamed protein product [Clonostachys solani]